MAEGFARRYGSDVMEPASAGFTPALIIQPLTKQVMEAKNIKIENQYPKDLGSIDLHNFDLIINMSGLQLPSLSTEVRNWKVEDPIGGSEELFTKICNEIENLVMRLILDLRRQSREAVPAPGRHRLLRNRRIS